MPNNTAQAAYDAAPTHIVVRYLPKGLLPGSVAKALLGLVLPVTTEAGWVFETSVTGAPLNPADFAGYVVQKNDVLLALASESNEKAVRWVVRKLPHSTVIKLGVGLCIPFRDGQPLGLVKLLADLPDVFVNAH